MAQPCHSLASFLLWQPCGNTLYAGSSLLSFGRHQDGTPVVAGALHPCSSPWSFSGLSSGIYSLILQAGRDVEGGRGDSVRELVHSTELLGGGERGSMCPGRPRVLIHHTVHSASFPAGGGQCGQCQSENTTAGLHRRRVPPHQRHQRPRSGGVHRWLPQWRRRDQRHQRDDHRFDCGGRGTAGGHGRGGGGGAEAQGGTEGDVYPAAPRRRNGGASRSHGTHDPRIRE